MKASARTIAPLVAVATLLAVAPAAQSQVSVTRQLEAQLTGGATHQPRQAPPDTAPAPTPADQPAGGVPDYVPSGPLIVDNGFRPQTDGFSFENYSDAPAHNLTPAVLERMFGHQVCSSGSGSGCVLTPPAQKWMDGENESMGNGHCYGFSVAALRIWKGQLRAPDFGAPVTPQLMLDRNLPLQETIAESYAYQDLPSVLAFDIYPPTPNDMLNMLRKDLADRGAESWTLGIFHRDGSAGHAVTPYAIEDRGAGKYNVLVYDNNYPGVTRAIAFDTAANRWSYVAQTNPDDPAQLYEGDRTTKNLDIAPTTPGQGLQKCPFCKASSAGGAAPVAYNTLSLVTKSVTDHAHMVIDDGKGHTAGIIGGQLVNTIPGVKVVLPRATQDWLGKPEPKFQIPRQLTVGVTIDASALTKADQEDLNLTGPGYDISTSELTLKPRDRVRVSLAGNGQRVSYRSNGRESPFVALGYADRGLAYAFVAKAYSVSPGSTFTINLDPRHRRLHFSTVSATGQGIYGLGFGRQTGKGVQTFAAPSVRLRRGETGTLAYGKFKRRGQTVPLLIRRGRHVRTVRLHS
ncbi:MAG TPA: hypothetical protein VGN69_03540 [Solirubrobacteraceae bacterium]|jgi:hypothetical protein|nr:hypothetical protein [Solirubrobacteraceae bacterium]